MPEEKKDVTKLEVKASEEESNEEAESANVDTEESKDVTPPEESSSSQDIDKEVDELLHDGTSKKKEVTLDFDRFSSLNDKAKQAEELQTKVDELTARLEGQGLSKEEVAKIIDERVSPITLPLKAQRERETREVLGFAIQNYPDFKAQWNEVRPLVAELEKSGITYGEALKRAYLAVNPQYAVKIAELDAQQKDNARGISSTTVQGKGKPSKLTPEQQEEARRRGWTEEKYLEMTADKVTFKLPTKSAFPR